MLVTTAMAVVLSASAALATDALVAPGPSDDAYHYRYFADGKHDGNYLEWWYFNFLDAANDVQAIFSYAIVDPENLTGSGMAFMGVIAYTPEGVVADADSCPVEQFHASYYDANVEICGSDIVVLDRDTYRIQGSIASGLVSWDLTYSSRAEPWFSGDREWVGLFPWERMSWLVYMPGAEVSGTIEADEVRIASLAERRGIEPKVAEREIARTDRDRLGYLRRYHVKDPDNPAWYDLVVNTGSLGPEKAADVILAAWEAKFGRPSG